MSKNCVRCIKSKRTGNDLLCSACRQKAASVQISAECVSCKHRWAMTDAQIEAANEDGMAQCPKCYSPATAIGASHE